MSFASFKKTLQSHNILDCYKFTLTTKPQGQFGVIQKRKKTVFSIFFMNNFCEIEKKTFLVSKLVFPIISNWIFNWVIRKIFLHRSLFQWKLLYACITTTNKLTCCAKVLYITWYIMLMLLCTLTTLNIMLNKFCLFFQKYKLLIYAFIGYTYI